MCSASRQDFTRHINNPLLDASEYPLKDSGVRFLVAALKLPGTRPEPSAHPADKLNLAFRALELLSQHLHALSPTANAWTEPLMVEVVESSMAFIRYYVREIVLRGKTVDFRNTAGHDFHFVVMQAVAALDSHPFMEEDHPKSKAYGRELNIFLANILPALLLTYDSLDTSSSSVTTSQVSLLFELIKRLHWPEEDPAWRDPLYENFFQILEGDPAMHRVLASAFLIAAHGFRGELMRRQHAHAVTAQDHRITSLSIFFAYHFITPFIQNDELYNRLLQGGLTRTTCELLSAVAREAREAVLDVADTREKWRTLGSGASALSMLGEHITLRLKSEGRARVELALQYDVLYQMRVFDRLLHELGSETGNQDAMVSEFGLTRQLKLQDEFIETIKPYLIYYEILEKVSKRILNSESTRESAVWKSFAVEIERLENDRIAFDKAYRESCQASECPHSYTKSPLQTALHQSPTTLSNDIPKLARANSENHFTVFRCSGCRLVYYCSKSCQQNDWQEHKSICASVKSDRRKYGGLTNVLSRRDITFMHTVACLTLSRHPPPDGLVQDMDFTTSPPRLSLQSLDNPVYDDAKIVVGDYEIHEDVIRNRALDYMRSLEQEVGIVYNRQFLLPEGAEAVLTFVNWEMLDGEGLRYKRRS